MKEILSVDVSKAWIETASGGVFHILDPQPEEIKIEDIAHALSMLCRFTGHCRKFYSVSEHSVLASLIDIENPLWSLMHDASEAYIADINRPLKHFTQAGPAYKQVEKIVMTAICKKFNLLAEEPASVKKADDVMLYAEKEQLMWPMAWDSKLGDASMAADIKITGWSPEVAKAEFLHRYYKLTNQL